MIEAVPEDAALKRALWQELDGRCSPATIFASNTSSLSITELAAATGSDTMPCPVLNRVPTYCCP